MKELIQGWKFDLDKVKISNIQIELSGLSQDFDNFQIVQISDFHLGSWLKESSLYQIIDTVNQLHPDLIAITGDLVDSHLDKYTPVLIDALSRLKAKEKVVAVLGNHDHWTDPDVIREVLGESNIVDLSNRVYTLRRNSSHIHLSGIDDHLAEMDDLDRVISQIPDDNISILLAHEPDFADISSLTGKFDLQLSGHTHGGQICVPIFGSLYLPRHGRKYSSGKYQINGMTLYTNRGLGTSWLPFRYNCPPEIAVLILSRKNFNTDPA